MLWPTCHQSDEMATQTWQAVIVWRLAVKMLLLSIGSYLTIKYMIGSRSIRVMMNGRVRKRSLFTSTFTNSRLFCRRRRNWTSVVRHFRCVLRAINPLREASYGRVQSSASWNESFDIHRLTKHWKNRNVLSTQRYKSLASWAVGKYVAT